MTRSIPTLLLALVFALVASATAVGAGYIVDTRTATANDIAAAWLVATLWGVIITLATLRDKILERELADDNLLARVANANVRREVFRLLELFALMLIGAMIVFYEPVVVVSRILVLIVVILLVTNAVLDRVELTGTYKLIRSRIRDRRTRP